MQNNNNNHHLVETRNEIMSSIDRISDVAQLLNNNSEKLNKTQASYTNYESSITKSGFYLSGLTRRHKFNILIVYGSFFFLIFVVVFIIIRRLFYRNFYQLMFSGKLFQQNSLTDL